MYDRPESSMVPIASAEATVNVGAGRTRLVVGRRTLLYLRSNRFQQEGGLL